MKLVLDVISKGAAQSWQMENRGGTMVDDKFDFGFAVDWMRKDLGLVLSEARSNGARLPPDRSGRPVLRRRAETGRRTLGYVQPDQAPARLTRKGRNNARRPARLFLPACAPGPGFQALMGSASMRSSGGRQRRRPRRPRPWPVPSAAMNDTEVMPRKRSIWRR